MQTTPADWHAILSLDTTTRHHGQTRSRPDPGHLIITPDELYACLQKHALLVYRIQPTDSERTSLIHRSTRTQMDVQKCTTATQPPLLMRRLARFCASAVASPALTAHGRNHLPHGLHFALCPPCGCLRLPAPGRLLPQAGFQVVHPSLQRVRTSLRLLTSLHVNN
jgi:hypothetical protein